MFAVTDTALDFLVLQLVFHGLCVGVRALVLGVLAPVDTGSENDVLADRSSIGGWSVSILPTLTKLAPGFPIGDARVDRFGVGDVSDPSNRLDLLVVLVIAEGDDSLGTIFV